MKKSKQSHRFSIIPNFFTLFNLTLGFLAILISSKDFSNIHNLTIASGFIFLAVLLDGVDGAIARLLKADSSIGAQLDSLADLVTSGLAPAYLMFSFLFHEFYYSIDDTIHLPVGMLLTSIWPICAAYRLSRFNIQPKKKDSFIGLPTPAAAVAIATTPIIFSYYSIPIELIILFFLTLSFLMVSPLAFAKPQTALFRRFSTIRALAIIFSFLMVTIYVSVRWNIVYGTIIIFIPILIYLSVGVITFLIEVMQRNRL